MGLEDVKRGPKGEWDIEGNIDGDVLIFEAKGMHGNPGRGDVLDLGRHIIEFEKKNPDVKVERGILVGNSERTRPLSERNRTNEGFNGDAVGMATKLDHALVNTWTLYQLVTEVVEGKRVDAKDFLRELRNTVGVYRLLID